jgi:hypothetical protein
MKTLLTAAILLVTTTAYAESLEEKQFWKRQRNYVDEKLKVAEKACGFKIAFDWVEKETLRSEVEKTKHSPNGVCTGIIDDVAAICRQGDDEKAAVKAKISSVTCGYAKERNLDLKGGTLNYRGNNTQSNFSEWARPWLLKHL